MKISDVIQIVKDKNRQLLNAHDQEELETCFIQFLDTVSYLSLREFHDYYSKIAPPPIQVEQFKNELELWVSQKSMFPKDRLILFVNSFKNVELKKIYNLFNVKEPKTIQEKKEGLIDFIEQGRFAERFHKPANRQFDMSEMIQKIEMVRNQETDSASLYSQIHSLTGPLLNTLIRHFNGMVPKNVLSRKEALIQFIQTGQFPEIEKKPARKPKDSPQVLIDRYLQLANQSTCLDYDSIKKEFEPIGQTTVAILKQICEKMEFTTSSKKKQDLIDRLLNHLFSIHKDKVQRISS